MASKVSSWDISKRFLIFFMPLAILIGIVTMVIYSVVVESEIEVVQNNELNRVELLTQILADDFTLVVSDLMILSEGAEMRALLESGEDLDRSSLADVFFSFSARRELYDQIRFIDETGMEIVRVNFNKGTPAIVPDDQLQDKGERYYFEDSFQLEQGEVFVSPLDLNIEYGEIEKPLKPMLRFATPVFDSRGRKRGIVILNYFGAEMIQHLEWVSADATSQIMLLNSDGFWLSGPTPEEEWGFMYDDGGERTFGNMFPEVWQRISVTESEQFHDAQGLFTFATVYPILEAWESSSGSGHAFAPSSTLLTGSEYYWRIVSYVPQDVLTAQRLGGWGNYLLLDVGLLGVISIFSFLLARSTVKRKQADDAFKASARQLGVANEKLEAFSYSVSHDLRAPLRSIRGFAEIIARRHRPDLNEEGQHYFDNIIEASAQMDQLINDLLAYSRLGRDAVPHVLVPLGDLFEQVKDTLAPRLAETGAHLSLPDNLPVISSDWTLLREIFTNLLDNALTYRRPGVPPRVIVSCQDDTDHVTLCVADDGIGIPPEFHEKVFNIFQRLHSQDDYPGTGIGLASVKSSVELLDGQVWIEPEVGEGTTFCVKLPRS